MLSVVKNSENQLFEQSKSNATRTFGSSAPFFDCCKGLVIAFSRPKTTLHKN